MRTYDATVSSSSGPGVPANSRYYVSLSAPPFMEQHRLFQIGVAGDYVAGALGDLHGTPGLAERITNTTYLAIDGWAEGLADMSGATVSVSLDGSIDYCEVRSEMSQSYSCVPSQAVALKQCASKHQLTLRRQ